MGLKKFSSVFQYTNWILKKYTELQLSPDTTIYRIVQINQTSSGYKLIIQVVGKCSVITCTPQEIVAEDRFLEGFSKKDVRTIVYLACNEIKQPRYKIIVQEFCAKFNRILFRLKKRNTGEVIEKTAREITLDKHIINNLSTEDACSINYVAGYEHAHLKNTSAQSKNKN